MGKKMHKNFLMGLKFGEVGGQDYKIENRNMQDGF